MEQHLFCKMCDFFKIEYYKNMNNLKNKIQFRVGILGNTDCGKSSLINTLTYDIFKARIGDGCTTERVTAYEYGFITYYDTPGEKVEIQRMNCDFYLILANCHKDIKIAEELTTKYTNPKNTNTKWVISKSDESGSKKVLQNPETPKDHLLYSFNNPEQVAAMRKFIKDKYEEFIIAKKQELNDECNKIYNSAIERQKNSQVSKTVGGVISSGIGIVGAGMVFAGTDVILTTPVTGPIGVCVGIGLTSLGSIAVALCKTKHQEAKSNYESMDGKIKIKFTENGEIKSVIVKQEQYTIKYKNCTIYLNGLCIGNYRITDTDIECNISIN
jgi:energy-coupling factor transporter ATP-binding protein EcfA2